MVLSTLISKFRLKEKFIPRDNAGAIRRGQPLPDSFFEVMPALVGGVNSSEAGAEREFGQTGGAVFLPCSTVEKVR
jgi:hypothetical protein